MSESLQLLAVSVGNTTTRYGVFAGRSLERSARVPNASPHLALEQLLSAASELPEDPESAAVVVASVNDPVALPLIDLLRTRADRPVYRLGEDLEIPLVTALLPHATPGQDRLLNALAAFDTMKQACVIVDCGSAVTVDFVDGLGVFQGGAIAPGASMSLHALHERTAALPHIHLAAPPATDPFGRDTAQAMLNGVFWGIRGLVRILVERYAEAYEGYPPIIATGGDAPLIFDGDEFIDRIVPDLTLVGIEAACRISLSEGGEDPADEPDSL